MQPKKTKRQTEGPAATFDALQRVQNILARVVTHSARRSSANKPLLELLHWLPVRQRVTYKRQLYATRQDRHRHMQRTFSHCSYHTSPLDHCGQATHRGWPFLELEQFLPAALSLSLHRPFGIHCRIISSTIGHLSNLLKATENSPFSLRRVKRSCHRAPLHFLLWRYKSFIIVLYCIVNLSVNGKEFISCGG